MLALVAPVASASPGARMTLAEANRLSPAELGKRLLGAAGESRGYVEKRVWGNGGGMIARPGLNAIDLYERPHSAGFEGLCVVAGVTIVFEASRKGSSDAPHPVTDFYQFKRFLLLHPAAERRDDADWDRLDGECAGLTPVADRTAPTAFAIQSDRPVDAYFAMRAIAKAQRGEIAIDCQPDPAEPGASLCRDPKAALAALPIRDFFYASVERCGAIWCVEARWRNRAAGSHARVTSLRIATDATMVDPPGDFGITALTLRGETLVYD
jgi:hypothetical protein